MSISLKNNDLINKKFKKEILYWEKLLKDNPIKSSFQYDFINSNKYELSSISINFEDLLFDKIKKIANNNEYSILIILLSSIQYLLYKYTNNNDTLIGMPIITEEVNDNYINNLLPIKFCINPKDSFKNSLVQLKQVLNNANINQNIPYNKLLEFLKLKSDNKNNYYFNTIVLLENIQNIENIKNLKYDILFIFKIVSDKLELKVEYNSSSYTNETINQIISHLIRFLNISIDKIEIIFDEIDILTDFEKNIILNDYNNTSCIYPDKKTINEFFEEHVNINPQKIAIISDTQKLTYKEFNEKANRLAHFLRNKGVKPDDIIGIMTQRSIDMMIGIMAILKSGAAYLPIDPFYPFERKKSMIDVSKIKILLTNNFVVNDIVKKIEEYSNVEIININNEDFSDYKKSNLKTNNTSENLAYVIFTSGSTGIPKGVMTEHHSLVNRLCWMNKKYPLNENDIILQKTPYTFDVSVWEILLWTISGSSLCLLNHGGEKDPENLIDYIKKNQITILHFVPSMLNVFLNYVEFTKQEEKLLSVKQVFSSGEALSSTLVKKFFNIFKNSKLANLYGPTEAAIDVTYYDCFPDIDNEKIIPIGKPIDNTGIYIISNNKLQPLNIPGELYIGGVGVARGYINNENLTNEKFIKNPYKKEDRLYKTGDIARIKFDNNIEYLGRVDHQVKIRGQRIELGEIEYQLTKFKDITNSIVIAELIDNNASLIAYYESKVEIEEEELKSYLLKYLPEYMIPSFIIKLDKIPLLSNGKIDRKQLSTLKKTKAKITLSEHPNNEIGNRLVKIWNNILNLTDISINDQFFKIGGDSIKAIVLLNEINKEFGIKIGINELYSNQTIKELSLCIKNISKEKDNYNFNNDFKEIDFFKKVMLEKVEIPKNISDEIEDFYPLSPIQQSMVFYSQLRPDTPLYHDQFVYYININNFNIELFNEVINILIDKNEILRTVFNTDLFNQTIQIVKKSYKINLSIEDISEMNKKEIIEDYLHKDLNNKFKFNNDILWRIKLYKLGINDYSMVLSFHHAVLDGWSVAVFNKDIIETYNNLIENKEYKLVKIKSSYKNYVEINLNKNKSEIAKNFWKNILDGYNRTRLPFNINGKKINDISRAKKIVKSLDKKLLYDLEVKANNYNCSLKILLLSAYVYLLSILTSEEEIVLGVVTHDRPVVSDSEKILGCFLNTIPLRINLNEELKLEFFINKINDYLNKSKPHELFLVDIANIIGESGEQKNPIFDCLFNFIDFHVLENTKMIKNIHKSDFIFDIDANEMTNTLFDLEVSKTLDEFVVWIKYSQDYFYEDDIKNALNLYIRILERFSKESNIVLSSEKIINKDEYNQIIYEYNDTTVEYPKNKTIHKLFEEQVEISPDNIALILENTNISYNELNIKSNKLSHYLISKGIKLNDFIGIIVNRNFDMIIGMLAILKSGGIYVPIDPEYPDARKEYIIKNSGIAYILTDSEYNVNFENVINLNEINYSSYKDTNPELPKKPNDLAYVIYTSGSTGYPKGVMIEHHSVVNLIKWINKRFNVTENDSLLFLTSICFDLSVYDIFGILATGGRIVIAQKHQIQNVFELKNLLEKNCITFWNSVPSTLNYLVNTLEENSIEFVQNKLRLIFLSGDWIPVFLFDKTKKYFPNSQIISLGGATEGTVWSIYYPIEKVEKNQISIPYGKPIDNNYFYILDKYLNVVPKGVVGELFIGGVGVARGYINNIEKTNYSFLKNKFIDSNNEKIYRTGDLGRYLPDGNIEFLGRKDFQLKIRGYRVEVGEIEAQLLKFKNIKDAVVVGKIDKEKNNFLCAYYTSNETINPNELKDHLTKFLPNYMIPSFFIQLENIPLTSNGKIDKISLPEPNLLIVPEKQFIEASNKIEQELINIWKDILNVEKISIYDNFFELGGHSLIASSLITKINKKFNISLPLVEIFSNSVLKDLSNKIINYKKNESFKLVKASEKKYYQVSSAQKRLFLLDQISDLGTSYNIPITLIINGEFCIDKVYSIFYEIVKKHESLRTFFIIDNDDTYQCIMDEIDLDIEFLNLENDINSVIKKFIRPFNLKKPPLFRLGVLKINENSSLLILDIHHIISDGISLKFLIKDFIDLYQGKELKISEFQYKDYSEWQNRLLKSDLMKIHEKYWLDMYKDKIPVLDLNIDFPRPLVQDFSGNNKKFLIENELIKKINNFCKKNEVTLFMFIFSIYYILLNKYTNQDDIVIGVPIEGRSLEEIKDIFGLFVNTLPIKNRVKMDLKYLDFLNLIKESVINAFEHQNYQYEELLEKLKIQRDISRNPLFDVVLVQIQSSENNTEINDLKFMPYEYSNKISKFDLTLAIIENKNSFHLNIEYSTKLFKDETITRMGSHLKNLINECLNYPEKLIYEINVLDSKEIDLLLNINNNKNVNYPKDKTIIQIFEEIVDKYPENIALSYNNEEISYKELNEKSNCIAKELIKNGAIVENNIAILIDRSFEMIISIFAILKAGCAYVPIDPKYPNERIDYILNNSEIKIVLTKKNLENKIKNDFINIFVEEKELYKAGTSNIPLRSKPEDSAYIIYTSGSTGNPKGVMVENKNVVRLMINDQKLFDFSSNDIWTLFHSYSFDFSVWEIFGALLFGGRLEIISEIMTKDPFEFLKLLREKKVTILNQTPTAFSNLLNEEINFKENDLKLKYIIFGGEKLNPIILKEWKTKYPSTKLINMYGITETTVHVTYKEITDYEIDNNISNIGKPIPTLSTYIFNKNMKLCPIGVFGELCVGGEGVARGYSNDNELTSKVFIENPYIKDERIYRSGDYAKLLDNGEIEYQGRIDTQVKIRGFRIELEEIEKKFLSFDKINQIKIIVKEDNDKNKYLCAYYISKTDLNSLDIRKYLLEELPEYMIPSYFIKTDKMPLTTNGKIDISSLPNPKKEYVGENNRINELDDLNKKLISIWKDVLSIDQISINDNFFELGGDSIIAIRLVNNMNRILNCSITIKDLYQYSNLKDLSNIIKDKLSLKDKNENKDTVYEFDKKIENIKHKFNKDIVEDVYPVSDIEFGMLYYYDKFYEDHLYHDQMIYFINESNFEYNIFKNSVKIITEKHPILRTVYNLDDYEIPIHIVHKIKEPDLRFMSKKNLNKNEIKDFLLNYLEDDKKEIFKINENLWRIFVVEINDNLICLILCCHHAILDGWSVASLITELSNVYFNLKNNNNYNITSLKNNYKQYIIEQLKVNNNQEIIEFWKNELKNYNRYSFGNLQNLKSKNKNFKTFMYDIDIEIFEKIKVLQKEYNTSIKTFFFCAYILSLYMFSYDMEFVVGLVENNRPECEDGDKILGCFLNTIPVNIFIDTNKSYKDFIKSISEKLIKLKYFGKMSLKKIVEILDEKSNNNPFFDTLFNYIDFHVYNNASFNNNESDFMGYERTNTLFDFNIINILNNKINIRIDYLDQIFSEDRIQEFLKYYNNILKIFINNSDSNINKIDITINDEKNNYLKLFNNTYCDYRLNTTINSLFEQQIKENPETIAVKYNEKQITYKELGEKVNCVAKLLRDNGIQKDKIVGLLFDKSIEMIIGIMGVIKSGGAYLPISPDDPEDRIKYFIENSKTNIILSQKKYFDKIDLKINFIDLENYELYKDKKVYINDINTISDLAYLIYTSGSTGEPKGVMIEHKNVLNFSYWFNEKYNLKKNKNMILMTNYTFDVSVEEIIIPLLNGATIYSAPKEIIYDKEKFYNYMIQNNINLAQFVPTTLRELLLPNEKIKSLNIVISGGERLDKGLIDQLLVKGYELYNHYGPTETTMDCLSVKCEKNKEVIGKPIANTKIYILDKSKNIQPIGVIGEIYVTGNGVGRGYLGNKELTNKSFLINTFDNISRNMYKTGDLGKWLQAGEIEFCGRVDNQIKINGQRIELGEIESLLLKHEYIKNSIVIIKKDKDNNDNICAYYISDENLTADHLKAYLKKYLSYYMIPRYFIKLNSVPVNQNGKIDIKSLPEPIYDENTNILLKDKVYNQLINIWKEILNLNDIDINENFFDMGGNSLSAMSIISKIKQTFNIDIKLQDFFENLSIFSLYEKIITLSSVKHFNIVKSENQDYYDLSYPQKAIFLASQFNEKSDLSYNMPSTILIEGKINITYITEIFNKIVQRHDSLRTIFKIINGNIVQKIINNVYINIDYIDNIEKNNDEGLEEILKKFIKPFSLDSAPLLKLVILKIDPTKHILFIDMHHIISDEVSIKILIKEFYTLYNGKNLESVKIQYKDYLKWQYDIREKGFIKNQEEFWCNNFKGNIPKLKLPFDFPEMLSKGKTGNKIKIKLDNIIFEGLKGLQKDSGATLYMVILAVYNILLYKYTEQTDIIIGTPTSGRTHDSLENTIGLFINILAMRNFPRDNISFIDFLNEVKLNSLKSFENQDYHYYELIDFLSVRNNINQIFNTFYVYNVIEEKEINMNGLKFSVYNFNFSYPKYDLILLIEKYKEEMEIIFEYNSDIFKRETVEKLQRRFICIMKNIINNYNIKIRDIDIFNEDEKNKISNEINKLNEIEINLNF